MLSEDEVLDLSNAVKDIVSKTTDIEDVFVYANSAKIKVQVAPVEIFIRMSADINEKNKNLLEEIKSGLKNWKNNSGFSHPINLTIIPMKWQIEIGI